MKTLTDNIRIVLLCLLSLFAWLLPTQSSVACSAHNHLCSYHALGTPRTDYDVSNDKTRLVIIAKATDTSHGANKTDFDNHVLLPKETTSFDIVGNPTTESTEPFIFRKTSYGRKNISDVSQWETPDTQGRHVYSSQYQVIYNKNTAQAIHTGDLNGGEKGRTPYQSGCPAYEGKANCEAIVITGNVPSGTYSQIVQMFNHHNKDNPKANLILGAWTTGDGILISNSHLNGNTEVSVGQINQTLNNGTTESYNSTVLEGNKAQTLQYDYNFYNRGFKPHAIGTTSWNHNKQYHPMGFSEPYNVTNHKKGVIETKKDAYYRTSLDTTKVNHLGEAQTTRNYGRVYKGRTLTTAITPTFRKKEPIASQKNPACYLNPQKCRNQLLASIGTTTKKKQTLIGPVQANKDTFLQEKETNSIVLPDAEIASVHPTPADNISNNIRTIATGCSLVGLGGSVFSAGTTFVVGEGCSTGADITVTAITGLRTVWNFSRTGWYWAWGDKEHTQIFWDKTKRLSGELVTDGASVALPVVTSGMTKIAPEVLQGGTNVIKNVTNNINKVDNLADISKIVRENINLSQDKIDYIVKGHFNREIANSRSVFNISEQELVNILKSQKAISSEVVQNGEKYVRVMDTGKIIGTTAIKEGGVPTSSIKIITDDLGNIVSAYPVKGK